LFERRGHSQLRVIYVYTPGSGAWYLRLGWSVVESTFYRELWAKTEVTIMEFAS